MYGAGPAHHAVQHSLHGSNKPEGEHGGSRLMVGLLQPYEVLLQEIIYPKTL